MKPELRPLLLPIFLNLSGKLCTVVGGGEVATRKVLSLLECGARVRVVAPRFSARLRALARNGGVEHIARKYQSGDLAGSILAFVATSDRETNEAANREAERSGVLVNVVDNPSHCSFVMPSKLERGPIQVAVSTQSASPALARRLREVVEEAVPPEYGLLAALARHLLGLAGSAKRAAAAPQAMKIGSRGSALALAQAKRVETEIEGLGVPAPVITIRTAGGRRRGPLTGAVVGVFVKEIEQALPAAR